MIAPRKKRQSDGRGKAALLWLSVLVVAMTCAVLAPCLFNEFTYDDVYIVRENPDYRGLGPAHLRWMFTTFYMGHWQPLSWVTLGWDYCLWGMNPLGYHLSSLLLHAINALLVFWLALALISRARPSPSRNDPRPVAGLHVGALLAALVFALHPLRVESVAWVTDRADVLATCFLLLTVLAYLRAHPREKVAIRWGWLVAAILLFGLSLMSRGMGVMLPIVLLLLDWYPLRRTSPGAGQPRSARLAALVAEKIPFLALAVTAGIVATLAKTESGSTIPLSEHGVPGRIAQAGYGLVFYIHKTLLPTGLVPMYELHPPVNPLAPRYLIPLVIVAVAVIGLLLYGRRIPAVTTAACAYAILLSPLLGLVQAGQQEVADRYYYFPSVTWAVLAGGALARLWAGGSRRAFLARIATPAGFLLVAVWAVQAWRQCAVWRTEESLWTHAVANGPTCSIAHYNLACMLALRNETPAALEHLQTSLRIKPGSVKARYNLGNAFSELGRSEEAAQAYQAVLSLDPQHAKAAYHLGNARLALGQLDEAAAAYRQALQSDPGMTDAGVNLGTVLVRQRRFEEAVRLYQDVLAREPERAETHYNLGNCLSFLGRVEPALAAYRRALELNPQLPQAHANVGALLQRQGRLAEAAQAYGAALQLDPTLADVRCNLANVLSQQGRIDEAISELRDVLRTNPDHATARHGLESLLKRRPATSQP